MNTYADKTDEKKTQPDANAISKKQVRNESAFQFVDNRPEAVTQRKLQAMVNNSSQVRQLMAIREMLHRSLQANQATPLANHHSAQLKQPIQRKENNALNVSDANVLQFKPADWNTPIINQIAGLPHGYFSTWKKIKTEINVYQGLAPTNTVGRTASLNKMKTLIDAWKQDPKHQPGSLEQRVQNILAVLPQLETAIEEERAEMSAEASEARDAGHSLTRHGPQLTDQQLQDRLLTAIAPDQKISPTPGRSNKFLNHRIWVSTKQQAANALMDEIRKVQSQAQAWNTFFEVRSQNVGIELANLLGPPINNGFRQSFFQKRGLLKSEYQNVEARLRANNSLPLDVLKNRGVLVQDFDAAAPVNPIAAATIPAHSHNVDLLNNVVKLFGQYSVRLDHLASVGSGVEKTGAANEITFDLEVLLNAIATWTGGPGWDTKVLNTIHNRATILGALAAQAVPVGHARDTLADFFTQPANIDGAKGRIRRNKKDVKIYDALQPAPPFNQTFTTFAITTRDMFDAQNRPVPLSADAWGTAQHYPAEGLGGAPITRGQ